MLIVLVLVKGLIIKLKEKNSKRTEIENNQCYYKQSNSK